MADLTPNQTRAVAALLTHGSPGKAAAAAGVSLRTLSRWQADPVFRAAVRTASTQALDATIGLLRTATSKALATLVEALKSKESEALRVRAAGLILDHALKADADQLRARVEALEEALSNVEPKT